MKLIVQLVLFVLCTPSMVVGALSVVCEVGYKLGSDFMHDVGDWLGE